MSSCTEAEVLAALAVGHRVWFVGERMPYTVQARDEKFIICTKPFAARKTVIYSVIDCEALERGPDNMVFGGGYETRAQCEERLSDFHRIPMELSYRRKCALNILKTQS